MFLKLTDLTRVFANGAVGLKGLDLEVAEGELLAILGPSGSGKTTLLRLICGLETPTRGEIHQDGKPTRTVPPHLRGIALVPQKGGLFPFLTVRQNLAFGKESGVWPFLWLGKPVQEHLEAVASQLGIRELLDRYPHEISGGQGQRVLLGRALVHRPRLLLLDEPFGSLDGPLRWELRQELHLLRRRTATTMIVVTQDQEEALDLGDRLAVLHNGSLLQAGSTDEVFEEPRTVTVARLLGWPPLNLHPATLRPSEGVLVLDGGMTLPSLPEWSELGPRRVLLGLRSRGVKLLANTAPIRFPEIIVKDGCPTLKRKAASDSVRVETEFGSWIASMDGGCEQSLGCRLVLDLGSAFLFDEITGNSLVRPRKVARRDDRPRGFGWGPRTAPDPK